MLLYKCCLTPPLNDRFIFCRSTRKSFLSRNFTATLFRSLRFRRSWQNRIFIGRLFSCQGAFLKMRMLYICIFLWIQNKKSRYIGNTNKREHCSRLNSMFYVSTLKFKDEDCMINLLCQQTRSICEGGGIRHECYVLTHLHIKL